jgi:hypothetical protein
LNSKPYLNGIGSAKRQGARDQVPAMASTWPMPMASA